MPARRPVVAAIVLIVVSSGSVLATSAIFPGATADAATESFPRNDSAAPSDGPDHGVNESKFHRLWSDDADDNNLSADDFDGNVSSRADFTRRLAQSTDIPYDHPPTVVERWNRGDLADFEPGDDSRSVHPPGASLEDGRFIRDAYVSIFAVHPSTVSHESNGTTQYVAPEGDVLAISDYRVAMPNDDGNESNDDDWSLLESEIESLTLSADGHRLDAGSGHRTTLSYADLEGAKTLTVEATISVRLRNPGEACANETGATKSCDEVRGRSDEIVEETVTVSATRSVAVNDVGSSDGQVVGFEARPNRTGAVVHPGVEWATIAVDGDVGARSNRRFYTAGRPGWETLVTRTATDEERTESSVRPLQVHAYPSREAPTVTSDGNERLDIDATWGPSRSGPTLPSSIDVAPADPYDDADSIALSSTALDESAFREVTVRGIVRGQSRTVSLAERRTVRETDLAVTVQETNATHAVVRARVTENATGAPVTTGRVRIENRTAALDANGTAVLSVSNPTVLVRAEYLPTAWWRTDRPYASSETVVKLPADFPDVRTLIQLVVVTILWFFPLGALVVGFDYVADRTLLGIFDRS